MSASGTTEAAEHALARLAEMSADLRSCAIVDASGSVLASSGDADWGPGVVEIWRAADALDGPPVSQVQVATEDGELFATRGEGMTAVALSGRHALASLMFCDLRSVLRELSG